MDALVGHRGMNKRQTRLFAIGATALSALAFIGLTVDSHRQFPALTNAQALSPQVLRGKDVWHANNCVNCHTLFGEGAYYAPDLTKIAQHRGAAYLTAYMRDPSKFYDERRHRRLMPKQDIAEPDIVALVAFLDWVSKVDNAGWPPRPIMVTGGGLAATGAGTPATPPAPTAAATGARPVDAQDNPIALGERLYRTLQPACTSCHATTAGVTMAGPSLAGVATRAAATVADPAYQGRAKDAAGYLAESITQPSAHLVAGGAFSASGVSFMPATYGQALQPAQVDQLVAYLATLK
jgi:nitric oxide reductase subunit C